MTIKLLVHFLPDIYLSQDVHIFVVRLCFPVNQIVIKYYGNLRSIQINRKLNVLTGLNLCVCSYADNLQDMEIINF